MLKWIGRLFIVAGGSVLLIVGYLLYDFYFGSNYQIQQTADYLTNFGYKENYFESKENFRSDKLDVNKFMNYEDFAPNIGESYAILEIPSIQLRIPIVYGIEMAHLRHGVGHDPRTDFPSNGKQIFLTGHNDSAFLKVDQLSPGDEIFINTPYGRFEYVMEYSEVGHESETWRIGDSDDEELVLMTCYPLFTLTQTERRYFVYSKLKGV